MPAKRKPRVPGTSAETAPAASPTLVAAPTSNVPATTYRLARVVAPPPRTCVTSVPQRICSFAEDASASLACLNDALTSKAAVALLNTGSRLAWKEAVIQSADVAVERFMLEAPAARTGAPHEAPAAYAPAAQQALPGPSDTTGKAGTNRRKSGGKRGAGIEPEATAATPAAAGTTATLHHPLSLVSQTLDAALDAASEAALTETDAPLRCLRERDLVASQGLASRKHRRRYKNADDVFAVVVDETGGAERNNPVVDGSARVAGAKRNPGPSKASGNSNSRKESSRVLQDTDVLVSVAVHNPAKPAMVLEEFLCLGSNTLGELKDRISCAADAQAAEAGLPAFEKRGAFFIEGVFHEDRRDRVDDAAGGGDGTTDSNSSYQYSTPIIEYRKSLTSTLGAASHRRLCTSGDGSFVALTALTAKEISIGTALADGDDSRNARAAGNASYRAALFSAKKQPPVAYAIGTDADETHLRDLAVVRSKPYLFRHRGDCDHVLTFRSVRLAHADDLRTSAKTQNFPLKTFTARRFRRKCSMCEVFEATFVTRNDANAPCSPCFFCDGCFVCLHENLDGGDAYLGFEKFRYYHE